MKELGRHHFPTTPEEAREWRASVRHRGLAMRVLAVAHTRIEGTWKAYIDATPGKDHRSERDVVLDRGDALPETVARAIFPEFEGVPYST